MKTPLYTVTLNEKGAVLDDLILNHYRDTVDADGALKSMIQDRARQINLKFGLDGNSVAGMEDAVYELSTQEDVLVVNGAKANH